MDPTLFYGVCYNPYWFYKIVDFNHDYEKGMQAINALGARTVRHFIHLYDVLKDPYTVNEEALAVHRDIVEKAYENGIEVIGQSHKHFNGYKGDSIAVPERDMTEGSAYIEFLLLYEQSWYTMVREFPEITYWEIGNEWNNDVFMHPFDYNEKGTVYTFSEKADIATDMLYYASRGIKRANPDAVTMMGGLVDFEKTGWGNAKGFLKIIYENIASGDWPSPNPDDYFETLGWHPYNHDAVWSDSWVTHNIEIYELIKEYEGHDKPIFFTEMGYSDHGDPEKEAHRAELLKKTMNVIKEEMPFVKCVCWFRLYNDQSAYGWAPASAEMEANFGLFTEPDKDGYFSPKLTGKAYQELTGSTSDLEQFSHD